MKSLKKTFRIADEYRTPSCLVSILVFRLLKWATLFEEKNGVKPIVWCPFDKDDSNYVRIFRQNGLCVVNTHIDNGQDFFKADIDYDIAISNPPFSVKKEIFTKLWKNGKPFIMLMNMMAINYQEIGELFVDMGTGVQFLIPDKKISFDGNTSSFCSGYVCYKFLEKTEFVHMENNNSKQFFKD